MTDADATPARTDGLGRQLVCEACSPDAAWQAQVFGPSKYCDYLYAHAHHAEHGSWYFGLGREPVSAERISFRWNLPNGSWGIFIEGECWAVHTHRAALRMRQHRIHSRSGPRAQPYNNDEIRFMCAKRRGQRRGTKGFVIEE